MNLEDIEIFIVDDYSKYSNYLMNNIRALGRKVCILGPNQTVANKPPQLLKYKYNDMIRPTWKSRSYCLDVLQAIRQSRVARAVHIQHEFYGIHTIGNLIDNIIQISFLLLFLRTSRIKKILTLHHIIKNDSQLIEDILPHGIKYRKVNAKIFLLYLKLWYWIVGNLADKIIVHSSNFRDILGAEYGINMEKISVIPHGIDDSQTSVGPDNLAQNNSDILFLYLGVISPRKGLETLIEAFQKFNKIQKNSKLILIGPEPDYYKGYADSLKERVDHSHSVTFLGFLDDEELSQWFNKSAAIVIPYHYSISASGVLVTAIQNRIPIIASKTPYFEEETLGGSAGLLVTPRDVKELTEAFIRFVQHPELRNELLRNQETLRSMHSWKKIAEQTLKTYFG